MLNSTMHILLCNGNLVGSGKSRTASFSWNWSNIARTNVLYRWNMHFKFVICFNSINLFWIFMQDQKNISETVWNSDLTVLNFCCSHVFRTCYRSNSAEFFKHDVLAVYYTNPSVVQKQLQKKQQFHDGTLPPASNSISISHAFNEIK